MMVLLPRLINRTVPAPVGAFGAREVIGSFIRWRDSSTVVEASEEKEAITV